MNKQVKYTIAIGIQTAIILCIILFKLAILSDGTEVLLKIQPVDPTSPLRGDYITFRYSSVSEVRSYNARTMRIRNGDTVYVTLRQSGTYWVAGNINTTKPSDTNQLFIRGKVVGGGIEKDSEYNPDSSSSNAVYNIVYGMEEYFIPEGKGQDINFSNKNIAARVVVDENGNAVLKSIVIDGKPWP